MATVRDMIRKKGSEVYAIPSTASVLEAMKLMELHNMGSVLAVDGGEMKGILSERDCARKLELEGRSARDTKVGEIMTSKVFTIEANEDLEACMSLMLEHNFRHLPAYDNGKLAGIISVRDVLREVVEAQRSMIAQLEQYIGGR